MPPAPRISLWGACRSLSLRTRPQAQPQCSSIVPPAATAPSSFARRHYSDDATPPQDPPTPSPEWMKARRLNATSSGLNAKAKAKPSFRQTGSLPNIPSNMLRPGEASPLEPAVSAAGQETARELTPEELALHQLAMTSNGINAFDPEVEQYAGLKFEPPVLPEGKLSETQFHLRHRYDEGIAQLTRLLMRHGKLSKAQNDMAMVLNYLRTSPAPKINPQRPLLAGAPPAEQLPLNPVVYFMSVIDSVSPLVRIRGFPGLSGGGKSLDFPVPLRKRKRRHMAFKWILDAVNKKRSTGSGKKMLAHRIGEEIVAVAEGRSGVWDRRQQLHKSGVSVRANLNSNLIGRRQIPV